MNKAHLNPKVALLSDFDGTITLVNVQNKLYELFADPATRYLNELWNKNQISTQVELMGCFPTISVTREEMESFLETVPMDPDFPHLLKFCKDLGIHFAILSDGLDWYIEYILKVHGFDNIPLYAISVDFQEDGVRFNYPWFDPETPLRGVSKSKIIRDYKMRQYHVVFIGDGISDTDALKDADRVYAKDYLLDYARANQVEVIEFTSLGDILPDLQEYLNL